jgi:hypothetical protein
MGDFWEDRALFYVRTPRLRSAASRSEEAGMERLILENQVAIMLALMQLPEEKVHELLLARIKATQAALEVWSVEKEERDQ